MTSVRPRGRAEAGPPGFEVATTSSDTLRAGIRVVGALSESTGPLLGSVVQSHVRAGRRYLRVELADAVILDPEAVLPDLRAAHDALALLGGLLVFEHADEPAAGVLRGADLYVAAAQ